MSFDWNLYFELGQDLIRTDESDRLCEARLRAATSRVYYAAYWVARSFAVSNGLNIAAVSKMEGYHDGVLNWYKARDTREYREAFDKLKNLRDRRTKADYYADHANTAGWVNIAEDEIHDATFFFDLMKRIPAKAVPKPKKW